ncbi:hypothetical protein Tco_0797366 [Tanacetum coccineum]
MLHIITLLAMASAVALGIYLAYVPYEEEFQYLAFILAILVPILSPHRSCFGWNLFWEGIDIIYTGVGGNGYSLKDKNEAKLDINEHCRLE